MPKKPVDTELIKRFSAVFAASGLSQKGFGETIGQEQHAISQVLGGSREPSKAMLKAIITKYDVTPEWLHAGTGPMKASEARGEAISREDFAEWRGRIVRLEEDVRALLPLTQAVKDLKLQVEKLADDLESQE